MWADRSILFAPLHYVTGEDVGGSEMQWAFEIAKEAAQYAGRADAVVCALRNGDLGSNVAVHEVDRSGAAHYFKLQERLRFVARYTRVGFAVARKRHFDLLHHVLPWGKHTFNPLILSRGAPFGIPRSTKVIMGPLQNAHEIAFPEDDEGDKFAQRFDRRSTKPVASSVDNSFGPLVGISESLCRATLSRADALIAVNESAAQMVRDMNVKTPVHVIPAGIRTERFPFVERVGHDGPLRILSASYFLKRKGIDLILNALAGVRAKGIDARLTLGGDGPQRESIERQIAALNLGGCVTLPGFIPNSQLSSLYAAADIYATMSWAEAHPVSLMEAMSTGLPVIAAANLGAKTIIEDDVTGKLVAPGDADGLARAIEDYNASPQLRSSHGRAGRERAMARYDWKAIGAAYREVYESVL